MKPRIFIASATASLGVARAFHAALEIDAEVTIWDQSVFEPSTYPLYVLLERAASSDFAVMVIGQDAVRVRGDGTNSTVANENVLIELGMFAGKLGLDRIYLALPRRLKVDLPSDLGGLTVATYDDRREDGNLHAAVATAAAAIMRRITAVYPLVEQNRRRKTEVRYFEEYNEEFANLCGSSTSIEACFIHSRRWREQHGALIKDGVAKGTLSCINLYLPDVRIPALLGDIRETFEDGAVIPGLIFDAFQWVLSLERVRRGVTSVYLYSHVPGHTFYRFDERALIALYPAANAKRSVPTLYFARGCQAWDFLDGDIIELRRECARAGASLLRQLCKNFEDTNGLGFTQSVPTGGQGG